MQLVRRTGLVTLILVVALGLPAWGKDDDTLEIRVDEWLVLGPVAHPLPVFHDAEDAGFDLEDLLDAEPLEIETLRPRAGSAIGWFRSSLEWRVAAAGKRGRLDLDTGDAEPDRAMIAWAAVWLQVDRWVEIVLG